MPASRPASSRRRRSDGLGLLRFPTTASRDLGSRCRCAGVEPARQGTYGGRHDADRRGRRPPLIEATAVTTVASLARGWAERSPKQVSMREKDFGIWREYTWEQTWELIEDAAHGLLALGVEPGDRVSIHCEDRPEWIILDLATVAVRGITVGLYPTNPTSEVEYLLDRLGRQDPPRRGPGTGRQGVPDRPPADPRPAADHLRRAAGPRRQRRRSALVLGELPRARSRAQARSTPTRSPPRMRERRTGRRDDARLHVGHHRSAEGGDAHQQERRVLDRPHRQQPGPGPGWAAEPETT